MYTSHKMNNHQLLVLNLFEMKECCKNEQVSKVFTNNHLLMSLDKNYEQMTFMSFITKRSSSVNTFLIVKLTNYLVQGVRCMSENTCVWQIIR